MKQYTVTGMSCAACSARVEKAVSKVEGVDSCSVSLLTNSMGVEGTASPAAIIAAVEEAGYGAAEKGVQEKSGETKAAAQEELLKDKETPGAEAKADRFPLFSAAPDVCLYGAYDVGLAASGYTGQESCGGWNPPIAADDRGHGH